MTAPAELAPPPLWTFHLPGKHGQKSHGHLGGLTGQDALDAVPAKLTPAPGAHTGDYTGAGDLSDLWNLTAAAPRQVSGPSLQELDDAADAMAAVVATQLGRVAGFAARNLGGVTIASGLWDFEAPNQPRDSEGRWTEGGGGDIGEPIEPTVLASVQVGDYTVQAVDDPDGSLSTNLEPGKFVEVTEDAREDPGGGMLIKLAKADGIAGGIEGTAQSARNARTPTGPDAFDNGPAPLTRRQVDRYDIAAYHDGNGDLFGEGERFITLSAPRSRREPVDDWDNADVRMGLGDADAFARALRDMADMFTTASGLIAGPRKFSGLWTFQTGSTPRQAAVSPDDLAVIRDQWTVITDDVLGPKIAADYLAGAKGQHDRLAVALPPKVRGLAARPLADQAALLYAAGAANRLKGIGDELWAAARIALLEGMAKGESVAKLARRIRDATGVAIGRATTIARTESMGARSAGSYEEMLNSDVVVSKTWQATGDLRTRPTHVVADGQTVPMAGKFTVGGWPADRPHDPMLPAEEAVNCRCTLTYGVDTDVATVASAVGPASPDLWIFHLPGRHDQSTHGGGRTVEGLSRGPIPSISAAAEGTNPKYGSTAEGPTYRDAGRAGERWDSEMGPPPSGAYEENCTNTVMAFEMRMRGYDAQAAPMDVLDKYGYAGGRTPKEIDDLVTSSWRLSSGRPHGRTFAGQKWRSWKDIDKEVESWPEGGRGFMTVGKHVFSVVKKRGRAQYVESQFDATPNRIVTRQYKKKYGREAKVIRLDDLEPTDDIFEAIRESG